MNFDYGRKMGNRDVDTVYMYSYASPLGEITLAGNEHALTGLWFVGQKYYADTLKGSRKEKTDDCEEKTGFCIEKTESCRKNTGVSEKEPLPVFQKTADWLDIYFSGKEPDFTPEISLSGSPFQMAVWEILKTIPYGQTMTYGEIAERIAQQRGMTRMSAQAVGGAVGRNPVSILVPCHRVVGTNGSLTGYAGGIVKKVELLRLEGVDIRKFREC